MDDRTIVEWASEIAKAGTAYYSGEDYSDSNGQQRYFKCFVTDGIVCQEKWAQLNNPRVLVILRETREQFDYCRSDIGGNIFDLTKYLTKPNDEYKFEWNTPKSTYRPVKEWIETIFKKYGYDIPKNDNIFEHVAVMNLKKTPGGATHDNKLGKFCKDFKERLYKQIHEINPKIIILANEYNNFFKKIMKDHIACDEMKHVQSNRKDPSPLGLYICKQCSLKTSPLLVFNAYHPCTNRTTAEDFQILLDQYDPKK